MVSWWVEAKRAAAHEFGRRHWRSFAFVLAVRRVVPAVAVVAAVSLGAASAWYWWTWWTSHVALVVVPAVVLTALVGAGWLAWRRWGWLLQVRFRPGWAFAAAGVLAFTVVGAVVVWRVAA